MTAREMTKLCAEAMKLIVYWGTPGLNACPLLQNGEIYDPLHDDAQAMALVKKFRFSIEFDDEIDKSGVWIIRNEITIYTIHTDLNRAIVECVAKMQAAKK